MYQPIASLRLPGFVKTALQKLGCNYCKDVTEWSNSVLTDEEWNDLQFVPKTKTALDLFEEECVQAYIPTLCKELDEALGNGVNLKHITELCGLPGSGRSYLCYKLCINCQLPKSIGGLDGQALYLSTTVGISPKRMKQIAMEFAKKYNNVNRNYYLEKNMDLQDSLSKIHNIELDNATEFISCCRTLENVLISKGNIRLVVIDSISAPLKMFEGRERTNILYKLLGHLQQLSQKYNFAIVLINDFTTRIQQDGESYTAPSLGDSYYHRINTRIRLVKKFDKRIEATIVKSPSKPVTTVEFSLK